tara:strand:+ start:194 stop:427 length:234 start_codon:yes stop_codon:yes gene_type:complete
MYKITQALNDLKNYYGLEEFTEVNLNMVDVEKPFIRFKSGKDEWVLTLTRTNDAERIHKIAEKRSRDIHEEGENGTL